MVKNTSLSSDLDLIKELEGLRIKQKLLVESFSKNKTNFANDNLANINGKLDFLVKIFQEANSPSETESLESTNIKVDTHLEILDKLSSLEENFNSKFEDLSTKLDYLSNNLNTPSILPSEKNKKVSSEEIKTNNPNSSSEDSNLLPPIPDFTSSETVINEEIKDESKKIDLNSEVNEKTEILNKNKKNKWF